MSIADWWMPWSQNGYECHVCQLQYSLQLQCGLFQNKATVWRSVTSRCISHLTICKFRSFCKLAYTHKLLLCIICRNFNYDDQAPHCGLKTGYGTLASMSLTFTLEKSTFSRCFQICLLVDCLKAACKLLSDNNVVVKRFFFTEPAEITMVFWSVAPPVKPLLDTLGPRPIGRHIVDDFSNSLSVMKTATYLV